MRSWAWVLVILLPVAASGAGCGDDGGGDDQMGDPVPDGPGPDPADAPPTPDAAPTVDSTPAVDGVRIDGGVLVCGTAELYATCDDGLECASCLCFEGAEGKYCSKSCSDDGECPGPSPGCHDILHVCSPPP